MRTILHFRPLFLLVFVVLFTTLISTRVCAESDDSDDEKREVVLQLRKEKLSDPYRPCWHLTLPEGYADPFDPNGAIYKDGVYHLWYIYQAPFEPKIPRWSHVSSRDLLHWRWHPAELEPGSDTPEKGINSGNAFFTRDGRVAISYQGVWAGGDCAGNCLVFSSDPNLDVWTRSPNNPNVKPCSDTHMWLSDNQYFLISGGQETVLWRGDSCDGPMAFVGPFMAHDMSDVEKDEDLSCPDFFQLGSKWVLLGISHQRGGRYYVGSWNGSQFTPESHHRMNWPGGCYFASETLLDDSGRRICWSWLRNDESAKQVTVMSMPRVLSLAADGLSLCFQPPDEIEMLRFRPVSLEMIKVNAEQTVPLRQIEGNSLELDVLINPGAAKRFGINVFCSEDASEKTPIIIDIEKKTATIDLKNSGQKTCKYHQYFLYRDPNPEVTEQKAPITAETGDKVRMRIFLDKSVLEVFINESQCLSQLVYPRSPLSRGVSVFAEDSDVVFESVRAWNLFPANQW